MRVWNWRIRERACEFERPLVVGILNLTPDSFYASSRTKDASSALLRAEKIVSDGADMLDLGAESTRPGSALVDEAEQADILEDYGLYMNIADAIDSQGKKEVTHHQLRESEWKKLTKRYCLI